jgi:hypothetical protein
MNTFVPDRFMQIPPPHENLFYVNMMLHQTLEYTIIPIPYQLFKLIVPYIKIGGSWQGAVQT